ncbi:metallophosphoesterase family protein [Hymenobacter cellulosilyticus]|uniref:Metallophosphoesterase n=1 Tax=Hymenobacter cellulosilyticus TaxID=2932248 RepID=A0A8T9QC93_9BACT|nr:metallophosphoesterase [Hymenobacter cellulosilyticus]UOQ73179.1 metallophosphoesterase [Hymenobacter cellulosilyticus]
MMRLEIVSVCPIPLETISYWTTAPNETEPREYELPIYTGTMRGLPETVSALIVASDLQGVVPTGNEDVLLGEVVADYLELLYALYFPELDKENTLALLCGDLYANKSKRGASGNPSSVWNKFNATFGRTVGIAGNHDDFGPALSQVQALDKARFLTQGITHEHGLTVAGISGIIGRPDKNFRLPETAYLRAVTTLLQHQPDILLTHLSPAIADKGFQGEEQLTAVLTKGNPTLVFCGHSHWPSTEPAVLANGTQVLNVDSKVFLFGRA